MGWPVSVAEGAVSVDVADAVYPLAAVQGAAVLFLERAFVRLAQPAPGRTRLTLRPKSAATADDLLALGGEALNELLHQALRLDVGARTEKLRELVIGRAVLSSESPGDSDDGVYFQDDPLGIGRPWEENHE